MLLTPNWTITLLSDHPTARLAAEELRRTLQRIGGPALPITSDNSGPRITLRHGPGGDGFRRVADDQGLHLRGDGPRGLLYAVYDLLEALGCRWSGPSAAGEHLPQHEAISLPTVTIADRPALHERGLIIGHDLMLADAEQWLVWAARARLNTLFVHTIGSRLALGACRLQNWQARRQTILPLLQARGMRLELGGHHLRDLLPRRLFHSRPELFRFDGQRRSPDHNCCSGHPDTLKILARATAAFARRFPEADVYHLWPDDILGGGWCSCPLCRELAPADQALRAANACAAGLHEVRPAARVAYLAYHDTEAPPQRITPAENVDLLFAPRPRSYAHGIGAAENTLNRTYAARLAGNIGRFTPQRSTIFEYYLDGILFKSALPPLPEVIAADMRYYHASGVAGVHVLLTGDRPWQRTPINAALFARLAWEPQADPQQLLHSIAAARAPRSPGKLGQAYMALSQAWRTALDHAPAERPTRFLGSRDLISDPPTDLLDGMAAPAPLNEHRFDQLRRIAPLLAEGRAAWAGVMAEAFADQPLLAAEQAEWEAGALLLELFLARQRLYLLASRGASRKVLRQALGESQHAINLLLEWAVQHVPPRALAGHVLLRTFFQLQIDHIDDRYLAPPWRRIALRTRRAFTITRLLAMLHR